MLRGSLETMTSLQPPGVQSRFDSADKSDILAALEVKAEGAIVVRIFRL
jgi:hypothetical protein